MFDIKPNDEQMKYAAMQALFYDFGKRGKGDGSKGKQLVGILAETIVADELGLPRPDGSTGFDGGYDLVVNGNRADVKSMERKVPVENNYVHNLIAYQKDYPTDFYIFTSWNKTTKYLTVCGVASKGIMKSKADFFEQGSVRTRRDGSTFTTFAPMYEIRQFDLIPVNSLAGLKNVIGGHYE